MDLTEHLVDVVFTLFDDNGDGKLSQLEFRWMTDKKTLTNQSIKLMWSKCDTDRDGYLDFEEFKEMLLRSRARKELERLEEEEELGTSELEILRLEEESRRVKNLYKVAEVDDKDADMEDEIQEDIVENFSRMIVVVEPPLEEDIEEVIDFELEESSKVRDQKKTFYKLIHLNIRKFLMKTSIMKTKGSKERKKNTEKPNL